MNKIADLLKKMEGGVKRRCVISFIVGIGLMNEIERAMKQITCINPRINLSIILCNVNDICAVIVIEPFKRHTH